MPISVFNTFEGSVSPFLADSYEFPGDENTSIEASADEAFAGSNSMKVTSLVLQNNFKTRTPNPFHSEPNAYVMGGDFDGGSYGWEIYALTNDADVNGYDMEVVFWDQAGELVVGSNNAPYVESTQGVWTRVFSNPAIVPAGSYYLVIQLNTYTNEGLVGDVSYWDDLAYYTLGGGTSGSGGTISVRKRQMDR